MKKWLLCSFITLIATLGFALTSTVNGITWTYQVSNGEASITDCPTSTSGAITIPSTLGGYPVTSIGDRAFYNCSGLTSVTIPSSVTSIGGDAFHDCSSLTSVTIPEGVTSIGNFAFYNCSSLTSVTIPSSVTSIGHSAFHDCSRLTSFVVVSANQHYSVINGLLCSKDGKTLVACPGGLTSVTIPEGVTSIGDYAFNYCTSLTSVTIPSSVTSIGDYAFSECSSLTSVTIPSSVTTIGDWVFKNCSKLPKDESGVQYESEAKVVLIEVPTSMTGEFVIPNTVRFIHSGAFYGCWGLTSVTIPSSVTSIGSSAFYGCWNLTSATIPSSVTSIGGSAFYGCSSLTSVTIPSSVTTIEDTAFYECTSLTSVTIPYSVTSIGYQAFCKCWGLTSVTIPSSVTSIGEGAFDWCESLTSVTIPEGVTSIGSYAFSECSSLTSVTIPSSVTSIGGRAFQYCTSLTSVTIPEGVTTIGNYAFYKCSSLTSVTISEGVTSIGNYAFSECSGLTSVTIPEGVTSIGHRAFSECSSLTSVTIPEGVTSIGNYVFYYCTSLTSVTLPEGVTSIGSFAFSECSSLTSVTIPEGVTTIGNYAFYKCSSLTSVTIPSSVTTIKDFAFSGCSGLTSVHISNLAAWCAIDFGNVQANPLYYAKKLYLNGELITNLVIPSSVTSIGDRAFYNCSSLTSVTIPSSVTSIGSSAFSGCSSLTLVTIPEGVTSIGSTAFYNCRSLTSVTIPDGVTEIGNYAFEDCSGLTSVTIPSSVTSIGSSAFSGCSSLTSVDFKGEPPSVGSNVFYDISSSATGSYLPQYASEWEAVITGGKWKGLTMVCLEENPDEPSNPSTPESKFFTYEIKDNAVTITGLQGTYPSAISIPATLGGYPVTTIGDSAFRNCSSLTSVTISEGVTSIGSYAFSECSGLTSVTIPEGVTSIGNYAFSECSSLTSVTIPEGVTSIGHRAFSECSSLTSVTIPEGVTSIGNYVFYYCTSLTSVTIPEGVTSIGSGAFSECSSLTSVTIPEGVTTIWNSAFSGCSRLTSVTIPSSVTSIESVAFYNCRSLTSVTIPEGVTTIGDHAFYNCSSLTSVDFKGEPPSVGSNVFYNISSSATGSYLPQYASEWEAVITGSKWNGLTMVCLEENPDEPSNPNTPESKFFTYEIKDNAVTITGLQGTYPSAISIPAALGGYPVTTIGDSAFYNCSSLTSVTIPSSVTTIGSDAFYNCSGLTSVHISNLAAWCGIDFEDIYGNPLYYATKLYLNGELITDLVIPEGVTSIGDAAFAYCSSLTSVTIPSSVTSIGDATFGKCSSLTSVTIPEGVTTIGDEAFGKCSRLTSVTIPSGVTSIGDHAFRECSRLTSVTIPSSVTTIGYYAFYDCSSLTSVDFKGEPPKVGSDVFYNLPSSATGTYLPQYAEAWEAVITDGKWNGLWMVMARPENEILFTWDATKGFVDSNGNPVFIDNAFTLTAEFTMPSSVTSGDVITFHATSLDGMDVGALGMTDWSGAKVNYLIGSSKQLSGGHYSTGRFSNTGNKGNGPGVNVLKIEAESFENGTIATSNFKIDFAGASTVGSIENNGAVGEKGAEGATFGTKPFAFTSVTLPEGATLVSATLKMLPKDYTGPVESFGVNFMHGTGQEIITNDSFGFSKGAYVAPSQWTNVTASATGSTSINQYMVYWNARGSYHSGCATTSNMGKLLYGYLDDVASWNGRVKAEVMVTGLPVGKQYAVALILSGDGVDDGRNTYNEVFSPILINGETYSYVETDGVVSLVKGEAAKANHARQWGDRSTAAIANGLVEGSNVVFVEGLSGMTLSITSAMDEKEVSRLTIAGVQVWITNEDVVIPDESKDRDVISVNFLGRATTTLVTEEAGLVPANGWNNLSGNSGTVSSLTVWSDEVSVTKPVELTYSANNVWSWADATDDYLKGYLDDNGAQLQVSVTNIPFEEYSAIVYMATDVGGANIKPVLINGAYYIGTKMRMPLGYADRVIEQEKDGRLWGESRGLVGEYGRNALRVDGLSGDLSIIGARGNGIARNGIAAIQIVNTGAPLLDWQEVDWTAKGQLVKVSELSALTDKYIRLKLADGATLDYDTAIAEGNQIVLEGEGITVNISNIDVSRADVEANISGATTIQMAYTETNGITVDGITYSYFFRGVTDANWETVSNWSSKVRSLGEEIRYVDLGGSYAPGVPDCPALWDYTLLDGEMMATIPTGDDGYKTVQVALLEGWDPRFTVRNGVHLKIATLKKLQIGNNTTDFSEWRIDDASKVTINAMGTSKWEGTPRFYINNQEGLFVNIDVGQADYYLDDDGSLQTNARIYGVQTVKAVKIDLGDSSQLGKTRISRKLIGFATNDNATFNYEMNGVTSTSSDVTPKYTNVLENVGDYTFTLKEDGYYIEFIAYDVAPDSILLPEELPEATGEWLTDVLEASGITSGSAVLAEGTTVEALEAARLLGITPSVSVSGTIATVAAESTFEVSEVVVADNAVSLAVTIAVGAGELPETLTLGGAVKLMVSDTLDGEWTEVTPAPSQIKLTRVSENKATLSVTQASGSYKFFKVLVK